MLENYLIIHKSILPEYYTLVLKVRQLMESGKAKDVTQAVREVGISRSTYYKYKDYIFEPSELAGGRKAVLSMMLEHSPGVLSAVLNCISDTGGSVLTITQSLPIHSRASVTISLDVSSMVCELGGLAKRIERTAGVEQVKLIAIE